jgi:hypothetical protein
MDEKLRLDVRAALDAAIGPMPPASRFLSSLPFARRRPRLHAARPWVAGVATAALLAAVLAAPRLLGGSRPTNATPPTAQRPSPVVPAFVPDATGTAVPVTPAASARESSAPPTPHVTSTTMPIYPSYPTCTAGEIEASVTTDRPSYTQGDMVQITFSARNASGHTCAAEPGYILTAIDSSGAERWRTGVMAGAMSLDAKWPADESFGGHEQWNQFGCDSGSPCQHQQQVPPGTYTIRYQDGNAVRTCVITVTAKPTAPPSPTPTPLLPLPTPT